MPEGSPNIEISELIANTIKAAAKAVRVSLPAKIVEYDATQQRCSAQVVLSEPVFDEGGNRQLEDFPVIPNVPVYSQSGGGARLTMPVKPGDFCVLMFADLSLDVWLANGLGGDPQSNRRHNLSDAIAYVGINPFDAGWASSPADAVSMGFESGPKLELDESEIRVGGAAALALLAELASTVTELKKQFDTALGHTHAALGTPPVSGTGVGLGFGFTDPTGTAVTKGS